MLYKRNRNLDPTRINNYNKFLSSLDQTSSKLNGATVGNIASPSLDKDTDFKETINKIIEQISQNYASNNHSSIHFTGYNPVDSCCIANNDPNYYHDIINRHNRAPIYNRGKPFVTPIKIPPYIHPSSSEPVSVEVKETIHIETEINNISDILKLIEIYKLDSSIKYNINMKTLHEIKEPLEELNNYDWYEGFEE